MVTPRIGSGGRTAVAAALALGALTVHAAETGFQHKPPEGFKPIDKVLPLETGPLGARAPIEFDFAEGTPLDQCPAGLWQGTVTFVGHVGGDVEFTGTFLRCFPFGEGEARYPDGSTYVGMVNSYTLGDLAHLDASNTRMAVREGSGTHTRADGAVVNKAFKRGTPIDDRNDPRILAFGATVADLGQRAGVAATASKGGKSKKNSGNLLDQINDALKGATGANAATKRDAASGKYGNQPSPAPSAQGGGGSGASCLTGTFQRRICGNSNMTAEVAFSGGQRGTGYFKDQDCAMVCPQGRRFDFGYTLNGDGTMRIDYTGGQICGAPTTPNGGNQAYSCSGSNLSFGNDYQRVR